MRTSNELYKLVRSMNKREIGDFRQFSGNRTKMQKYLKLFERILLTVGDGPVYEKKLQKELEYTRVKTFYVAKNYLFELLLRSLCVSNYGSGTDDFIRNRILIVKLLYEKTLFSKAYELLKKTKKISRDTENYLRLVEIIKWERNLVIEGVIKGNKISHLENLIKEEGDVLKNISNISSFRQLSFRFNSFVKVAGQTNKKELATGLKYYRSHPLLKNESRAVTLASRITFFEINSALNMLLKKNDKVYLYRKKMLEILEKNELFRNENLTNYVITIYNFANICLAVNQFHELSTCIEKLRNISASTTMKPGQNTKMLIEIGSYRLETGRALKLQDFKTAFDKCRELAQLVKKYDKVLSENEKAESLLLSAEGLYLYGGHDKALDIIGRINGFNTENIEPGIIINTRLIQMIIMFELGNHDTVDYTAVSVMRLVKKSQSSKKMHDKESVMLKQAIHSIRKANSVTELKKFIDEIVHSHDRSEQDGMISSILKNWLTSRSKS